MPFNLRLPASYQSKRWPDARSKAVPALGESLRRMFSDKAGTALLRLRARPSAYQLVLVFLFPVTTLAQEPEVTTDELPRVPPLSPDKALASFQIRPGFRLELAACEPEVVDPVAMAFDENSALYVVEMRDYSERRDEKLSRVRKLEDRDGDGRFEHSTVFLDGLPWATSVTCWDGGVFVAASPDILFAKDTNGDGVADKQFTVFTGFGEGRKLNVQALLNSLQWSPRGYIHGMAAGNGGSIRRVTDGEPAGEAVNVDGAAFSFDPMTMEFRAESATAQFGMTFDEWGEKYVCSNSAHIQWTAYDFRTTQRAAIFSLPPALVNIAVDGPAAEVFRLSPEEPWRVVRTRWRASGLMPGLVEGGGRSSGYFTSASGIHISGGLICRGDAFIGDVGSNLVHRKVITWTADGPVAKRAEGEERMEFLASTDNWFRPVAFTTGPDGGLYIADMYREFIEHPDSLPPAIKQHLDLNSGNDRGRIWRVVPDNFVRKPWPKLTSQTDEELRGYQFDSAPEVTSWHRLTEHRLRCERAGSYVAVTDGKPSAGPAAARELWVARSLSGFPPMGTKFKLSLLGLPASGSDADWQPGLRAYFVRHSIRTREEAAELFGAIAAAQKPLACFRAAAFLETQLPAPLMETAVAWLKDRAQDETHRLAAVVALARGHNEELKHVVQEADQLPAVRVAALLHARGAAGSLINSSWPTQPGELRTATLEILTASSPAVLLEAIKGGKVSAAEIPAHLAAQLRRQPGAEAILPPPPANRQAVIAARQGALKLEGNAADGRTLFVQLCGTCHRDGNEGAAVGPDRASFRNQGKPMLLQHILDPNREVAPRFFTAIATTDKGETFAGIVAEETADSLRLLMPGGVEKVLPRSSLTKLERSNRSLMPEGIEAEWSDKDIADLLAFLVQ
jgi:putative membrane-bound dehydrogenase-like protein